MHSVNDKMAIVEVSDRKRSAFMKKQLTMRKVGQSSAKFALLIFSFQGRMSSRVDLSRPWDLCCKNCADQPVATLA